MTETISKRRGRDNRAILEWEVTESLGWKKVAFDEPSWAVRPRVGGISGKN